MIFILTKKNKSLVIQEIESRIWVSYGTGSPENEVLQKSWKFNRTEWKVMC